MLLRCFFLKKIVYAESFVNFSSNFYDLAPLG